MDSLSIFMIKVSSFPDKKTKNKAQRFSATAAVLLLIIDLTATTAPYASATTEPATEEEGLKQYVRERYGFAFSYPSDWVFEDFVASTTQAILDQVERQRGYVFLGYLCPEDTAFHSLVGYSCQSEFLDLIGFLRFSNLDTKIAQQLGLSTAERQQEQGNVTADDFFAYYVEVMLAEDDPESTIDDSMAVQELVSSTPLTIPIEDLQTGQIVGQAEGAVFEFVYGSDNFSLAPTYRAYQVFAINGDIGFTFGVEGPEEDVDSGEVPETLQTVIDTFRFVT
jgi:hypothetical protein